jgi:hypothetical protein
VTRNAFRNTVWGVCPLRLNLRKAARPEAGCTAPEAVLAISGGLACSTS